MASGAIRIDPVDDVGIARDRDAWVAEIGGDGVAGAIGVPNAAVFTVGTSPWTTSSSGTMPSVRSASSVGSTFSARSPELSWGLTAAGQRLQRRLPQRGPRAGDRRRGSLRRDRRRCRIERNRRPARSPPSMEPKSTPGYTVRVPSTATPPPSTSTPGPTPAMP